MNQLEEIKKLYTKQKTYKIPLEEGVANITLKALSIDEIGVMNIDKNSTPAEIAVVAKAMFAKCMDMTEDEVSKISVKHLTAIFDAVMDINGLDKETDPNVKKINDMLVERNLKLKESTPDESA